MRFRIGILVHYAALIALVFTLVVDLRERWPERKVVSYVLAIGLASVTALLALLWPEPHQAFAAAAAIVAYVLGVLGIDKFQRLTPR